MAQKALLLENNIPPQQNLARYLKEYSFTLVTMPLAGFADTMKMVDEVSPDVVILKVGHLCNAGKGILLGIHSRFPSPIILVTRNGEPDDAITGLELGADACIREPFNPRELVATMRALLRRAVKAGRQRKDTARSSIKVGQFTLNTMQRAFYKYHDEIKISGMEYEILKVMMKNPNVVLDPKRITVSIRRNGHKATSGSLRVHISNLRAKLGDDARCPRYIKSVWGEGYVFIGRRADDPPGWQGADTPDAARS